MSESLNEKDIPTRDSLLKQTIDNINRPKTSKGQNTFNNLVKAAEEIFGRKNYYRTSITEITDKAGVAPGTFYLYFPDKKAIFRTLIWEISIKLRQELQEATLNLETRKEIEKEGFRAFFSFIKKHPGLYKIVWQAQFVDGKVFKEYYRNFARGYQRNLKLAMKKGEFRQLNPEVIAYCLIGITNFVGLRWFIWEDAEISEDLLNDVMSFVFNGVAKD